jgi:hypothetical protein
MFLGCDGCHNVPRRMTPLLLKSRGWLVGWLVLVELLALLIRFELGIDKQTIRGELLYL